MTIDKKDSSGSNAAAANAFTNGLFRELSFRESAASDSDGGGSLQQPRPSAAAVRLLRNASMYGRVNSAGARAVAAADRERRRMRGMGG